MDLQTIMKNHCEATRKKSFDNSDQLTLGELILKIEPLAEKYKDEPDIEVGYDFEYLFPTCIDSWRGDYSECALNFVVDDSDCKPLNVQAFLKLLKETVGKTFTGYKGGKFTMTKNTPVWVANYGNSGETAIVDVLDKNYKVVLITKYTEY
jgi:hypothetical protein